MKKLFIIIYSMLMAVVLPAQHLKISGTVLNQDTQEAVPFANAALYTPQDTLFVRGATADENGRFTISGVSVGGYLIRVTSVGYITHEQMLQVQASLDLGQIALTSGKTLTELKVTAARPIFTIDGEKNIYNTHDDPSIQNGTVMDALQNAPGIEVDAEGNVRLRGTQEVSVWINDRECRMNEEALKQYLKTLPANSLKRIEVITNPSARYGGGRPVVNLITRNKVVENRFLSVGLNGSNKPEATPWVSYILSNKHWDIDFYANLSLLNDSSTTTGGDLLIGTAGDTSRRDSYQKTFRETTRNSFLALDMAYHADSLNSYYLWFAGFGNSSGWSFGRHTQREEFIYAPGDYSFSESQRKAMGRSSLGFMDGIWYEHRYDDTSGHALMFGYYGSAQWCDSLLYGERSYTVQPQHDISTRSSHRGG